MATGAGGGNAGGGNAGGGSAGGSGGGKVSGLQTGWQKLDNWSSEIADAINDNKDSETIRSFHDGLASVGNAATGRGGGGGSSPGGGSALETVTGAVNGVPATLQVMTDGNGWTEI